MRVAQQISIFFLWRCVPRRAMTSSFFRYLDHTQRRTTAGMTPQKEWSTRGRDLYLQHTTLTTNKQTRHRRDSNAQSQDANLRLRTRGHWDRQL